MTSTSDDAISIAHPPLERWQAALELVLSARPAIERQRLIWWIFQDQPYQRLEGLWEARCGDHLLGAALAMTMPGNTALVYQPRCLASGGEEVVQRLWGAVETYLVEHGVRLAQEVLPVAAVADAAQARAFGFELESILQYYAAVVPANFSPVTNSELELARCLPEQREVLEGLIERTYQGTLDCPELNGVRSSVEVVDGYLEGRPWADHQWYFVLSNDEPVGCLLLTPRGSGSIELVYLGLVPDARGRGWGKAMIELAIWLAASTGATEITVGVDARNTPARRIYESAGLQRFDERRVLLRVLPR